MESLKKVLSLNQASKITGYHQDYLSSLVRKGEIKAHKVGRTWFTTEEEIKRFQFKQKIRKNQLGLHEFLSPKRIRTIFVTAIVLLVILFSGEYFLNKKNEVTIARKDITNTLSSDVEYVASAKNDD